jgi:PIN domain nuclease of toxin-antitoxin system
MTYLIDTHTFIWAISDTEKLSNVAREIITSKDNDILVSVVSFWEIALKTSIKKFFLEGINNSKMPGYAHKMGLQILDLKAKETSTFEELPLMDNHKDPFDRMIIWQAITNKMTLISKDRMFEQYNKCGLRLVW